MKRTLCVIVSILIPIGWSGGQPDGHPSGQSLAVAAITDRPHQSVVHYIARHLLGVDEIRRYRLLLRDVLPSNELALSEKRTLIMLTEIQHRLHLSTVVMQETKSQHRARALYELLPLIPQSHQHEWIRQALPMLPGHVNASIIAKILTRVSLRPDLMALAFTRHRKKLTSIEAIKITSALPTHLRDEYLLTCLAYIEGLTPTQVEILASYAGPKKVLIKAYARRWL